jgi:preprotein translocase subunit SecD
MITKMKTIIYLLIAIFILGMLPLNYITANNNVRIVIEAIDVNTPEEVLKRSSDIMSARLNDAGITTFDIDIEPGRIIIKMAGQYATDTTLNLLIAKGRFEFREPDTQRLILEGKDIESMKVGLDPSDSPYAAIQFKSEVIPVWAEATRSNLNKPITVLLDNRVIYQPVVREVIPNGSCVITGTFTADELQYFSVLGNNGELPVDFRIVK